MAGEYVPEKDPKDVRPYYFRFCDKAGLNDGSKNDDGDLRGATISSITNVTADSGLTVDSYNKNAVTLLVNKSNVSYSANTVVTAWLSGGTDQTDYEVECVVVTSDSRTLTKTMLVRVRQQ